MDYSQAIRLVTDVTFGTVTSNLLATGAARNRRMAEAYPTTAIRPLAAPAPTNEWNMSVTTDIHDH